MDLMQLQYFRTIANLENITKASELLYVAQPNLSVSMRRLEDELGVALFDRRRGKIRLTPTGRLFLDYVDGILAQLDEGIAAVRDAERRSDEQVRVASTIVDLMGNLLREFLPGHESVAFRQLTCRNSEVAGKVLQGEADLGFVFGAIPLRGLEYIQIDSCERGVQLAGNHPLAGRGTVTLAELADRRFICNLSRDDEDLLAELTRTAPFRPDRIFECDDNRAEVSMILYGGGISIAPVSNYLKLVNSDPGLDMVFLRVAEPLPPCRLGMVRRTGDRLSPAALQFYEQVDRFFRKERELARAFTATLPG